MGITSRKIVRRGVPSCVLRCAPGVCVRTCVHYTGYHALIVLGHEHGAIYSARKTESVTPPGLGSTMADSVIHNLLLIMATFREISHNFPRQSGFRVRVRVRFMGIGLGSVLMLLFSRRDTPNPRQVWYTR